MAIAPMTGLEYITKFQNMVDDVLDTDFMYQLLNDAKNEVEAEQGWECLKYCDDSQYANQGDTIAVTHPLPANFISPLSLFVGLDYTPYSIISFEDVRRFRDVTRFFVIDYAQNTFALTGVAGQAGTIYLNYFKFSDDITDSTTWSAFPARFNDILTLKMAQLYYSANAGEKSRAWDDRWKAYYESTMNAMKKWDFNLKMRAKQSPYSNWQHGNPDPRVAFY